MKTTTVQPNNSQSHLLGKSPTINEIYENDNEINFKNFTLPVPMTEQEVAPPLHVWDKIARILDEQDSKKQFFQQSSLHYFQPQTFIQTRSANYKYLLAFLGAAIVVGIVWLLT